MSLSKASGGRSPPYGNTKMRRFMICNILWLLVMVGMAAAWWWDRSGLANRLKNAKFAIEHQKNTIEELSGEKR